MSHAVIISLHLLAAIIWIGGMFFAYLALRPAAAQTLEAPQRLSLWAATFARFFPWVWAAAILLLGTGYHMLFGVFGGFAGAGVHIHIMHGLGWLMVLIFAHVYFAPYRRLRRAVASADWAQGGKSLNQIRVLIAVNLLIGLAIAVVGSGGRYL